MTHTRSDFVKSTTYALVAEYWVKNGPGPKEATEATFMIAPFPFASIFGKTIFIIIVTDAMFTLIIFHIVSSEASGK